MNENNPIQIELNELNSTLTGASNKNIYKVPDNYFDVSLNDILQAISENSITRFDNEVPAGYFDGLADTILNKIKALSEENLNEDSSFLFSVKVINVFTVPGNYFENLADDVLNKLKEEAGGRELSILPSLNINVYSVPDGYFENLSHQILDKLPQHAKVVEMRSKPFLFRYAAAAVVTGIIGLSVISVFNKKDLPSSPVLSGTVLADANNILKTNSFDETLATISDKDIVNYLEKNGEDVNAALVASMSEDKNLPEEIDYLTDDKTLDNLLNSLKPEQSEKNN